MFGARVCVRCVCASCVCRGVCGVRDMCGVCVVCGMFTRANICSWTYCKDFLQKCSQCNARIFSAAALQSKPAGDQEGEN